jgi:hypothetical protein
MQLIIEPGFKFRYMVTQLMHLTNTLKKEWGGAASASYFENTKFWKVHEWTERPTEKNVKFRNR